MPKLTAQQDVELIKASVTVAHLLAGDQHEIFKAKFAELRAVIMAGPPQHADGSPWTDEELQSEADAVHAETLEIQARSAGGI